MAEKFESCYVDNADPEGCIARYQAILDGMLKDCEAQDDDTIDEFNVKQLEYHNTKRALHGS